MNKKWIRQELQKYTQIPEPEWKKFETLLNPIHFKKKQFFIREGEKPEKIAIIVSGLFRTFCITRQGEEKTLAFRYEGQLIAGYAPYLMKQNSWYAIQAIEDSFLMCFSFDDFMDFASGHACWKTLIKEFTINLFIEKEARERSFLMEDAKIRYLSFLEQNPNLPDRISQKHIASYLGISPVSLSRIRTGLK